MMCDRHPPFEPEKGDRAVSQDVGIAAAMDRAVSLVETRGERQKITVHKGPMIRAFFIQPAAKVLAWEASR